MLLVAHDVNPLATYLDRVVYLAGGRALCGEVDDVIHVVPMGFQPFTLTLKITTQPFSYQKQLAKAAPRPLPMAFMAS